MDNVYIGKAMPEDESEGVFCSRIGTTKEITKQAVLDALRDYHPSVVYMVKWDEPFVSRAGWHFIVKEKTLHEEAPLE